LFNAKEEFFSYIMALNEMTMSALYETNTLSWIFIVLAHWNRQPLDMYFHSGVLSWFRVNPYLFLIL